MMTKVESRKNRYGKVFFIENYESVSEFKKALHLHGDNYISGHVSVWNNFTKKRSVLINQNEEPEITV